jgi:hypothetical protein
MLNRIELDQRRADMMDALYERSGRTCNTYTGLWEEFCYEVAANFRDTDYADLHRDVVTAIGTTESVLPEKHAQQAIAVCRQHLLGRWA